MTVSAFIAKEMARISEMADREQIASTNACRAQAALAALAAFAPVVCPQTADAEIEQEYILSDLVCDLMHYADTRRDTHAEGMLGSARMHYEAEIGEGDDIEQDSRRFAEGGR